MSGKFVETTKKVRAQIIRRPIDSGELSVTVTGTVVYITGVLRPLRTHPGVDLKEEMNQIAQILRSSNGIAEVVWDVTLRV